ncbi:MAG: hypothetical protein JNL90_12090 [Planctomycetes bacterium]|nr:hypothetical protein [Planctomycetota bacterium]
MHRPSTHPLLRASLVLLVCLAVVTTATRLGVAAGASPFEATLLDFEQAELAKVPAGFRAATTRGRPELEPVAALWEVVEEQKAPSGKRIVRLTRSENRDELFNLLLREAPAPADLALSVRLRADGGEEDRGGGLCWRAVDEQNYYVARWNPLEKNLRIYRVVAGVRVLLQSVPVAADAAAWHRLDVVMRGRVITVSFDGAKVASCADTTFAAAGKVGLWTRSNARSSFDDLAVEAAPATK